MDDEQIKSLVRRIVSLCNVDSSVAAETREEVERMIREELDNDQPTPTDGSEYR
jgi:flagellar motor switch protein FliG